METKANVLRKLIGTDMLGIFKFDFIIKQKYIW